MTAEKRIAEKYGYSAVAPRPVRAGDLYDSGSCQWHLQLRPCIMDDGTPAAKWSFPTVDGVVSAIE
jgi:hypothetical protein